VRLARWVCDWFKYARHGKATPRSGRETVTRVIAPDPERDASPRKALTSRGRSPSLSNVLA
jgi:hypothetical protein